MKLREYQQRTIDMLYAWFEKNRGNPCLVLPTGSGKSHIIAELCKDAIQNWPDTRILMLTHVKELIEQNAQKLYEHWPDAPLGIYSASIGRKDLGEPITFAGIQSVRNKSRQVGYVDIVIIDECHLVSHKDEGGYRKLISELKEINPHLRVIGLTATPYRLGHGLITDKPAIFDALIKPVSIEELVFKGYLATLRSKITSAKLDVSGVKKRGGEFIESELQEAVDTDDNNQSVVDEVIKRSEGRKSWMFFATGVSHAQHLRDILLSRGISAVSVVGNMAKKDREQSIADFKSGKITAITQVGCLNVGFDHPAIDLLVMARPTMSPGLYQQQAGRGMRPSDGKSDCLVLDFAGVVAMHGPITAVQPPQKAGDGNGEAPVKTCEICNEICAISATVCPACGNPFPARKTKVMELHNDDIMGLEAKKMDVTSWSWRKHTSKASGIEMLAVTYYGYLSDEPVTEYLAVKHDGYAGEKAIRVLVSIALSSKAQLSESDLECQAEQMNQSPPPQTIEYKKDGKFYKITKRIWDICERASIEEDAIVRT